MMKKPLIVLLWWYSALSSAPVILESSRLKVELRQDLNGFVSIVDKSSGREYAGQSIQPPGLYDVVVWLSPWEPCHLTSNDAEQRHVRVEADGYVLSFSHKKPVAMELECRVSARLDQPFIRWGLRIVNASQWAIDEIHYPLLLLTDQLGSSLEDDAILYPRNEGMLLCKPGKYIRKDLDVRHVYPGEMSMQLLYYFDNEGGFYMAAHDDQGYRKSAVVSGVDAGLSMYFAHLQSVQAESTFMLPYQVLWTAEKGSWMAGADVYKDWAQRQSWCAKKIAERDIPDWLKQANVFLNFSATQDAFYPAEKADRLFRDYHEFLQTPVVATAFSWEKNGAWISPDYFPPFAGEQHYMDLARMLEQRGDHLHLFLSGFRWGVRRTQGYKEGTPLRYAEYDGTPYYEEHGRDVAAVGRDGTYEFYQQPWADNYRICVGSTTFRDLLQDCFRRAFALGAGGVDLDQDIGSEGAACFSPDHGHPRGPGLWIHHAMQNFLTRVQSDCKRNPQHFLGSEEICELYIPYFDIYHGRIFTDYDWPAQGPGAMAVPLFAYVYHEYILAYAGFCDELFSPAGDPRIGLGRSFIFGMQPGVRIAKNGLFDITAAKDSTALQMLRQTAQLLQKLRRYLLEGRMLGPAQILHSPTMTIPQKFTRIRMIWPEVPWPVVQSVAWESAEGHVCYATANLSSQPVSVELELPAAKNHARFELYMHTFNKTKKISDRIAFPYRMRLTLQPWGICGVEYKEAEP